MRKLDAVATIEDLAKIARRRMPKFAFNYLDGGAGDDKGVMRNRQQLDRIVLKPALARGVTPNLTTALFDKIYSMPFGIAPTGPNNLLWPDADEILAKVAASANIPVVVSTMATTSIERFAELARELTWFQLYPLRSETVTDDLLDRIWRIGITVLVVTIDVTTDAVRNRDVRGGFNDPGFLRSGRFLFDVGRRPAWMLGQLRRGKPALANLTPYIGRESIGQETARNVGDLLLHDVTWEHLKRLRKKWEGTLVIKGILDPDDAISAVDIGADAIWVSNHGGRLLEFRSRRHRSLAAHKARDRGPRKGSDGWRHSIGRGHRQGWDLRSGYGFLRPKPSLRYWSGRFARRGTQPEIASRRRCSHSGTDRMSRVQFSECSLGVAATGKAHG